MKKTTLATLFGMFLLVGTVAHAQYPGDHNGDRRNEHDHRRPISPPMPPVIQTHSSHSCFDKMSFVRRDWRPVDVNYVCTARSTIPMNASHGYTVCVEEAARHSNNGEEIINTCLHSVRGNWYPTRCLGTISQEHPEWNSRLADINYVCTARRRIPLDSDYAYTKCVFNQARFTNNGEEIINNCVGMIGQVPQSEGSCISRVAHSRPEWNMRAVNYVCSARGSRVINSDFRFTECVVDASRYSGNEEQIINACQFR